MDDIADRARLGKLARPLLSQFPKGIYGELMLDRLAALVGVSKAQLDSLAGSKQPEAPEPPGDRVPDHGQNWHQQGTRSAPKTGRTPISQKKSWSLKAIELILAKPAIALEIDRNLAPLAELDGENSRMLLDLIELVRSNPNITTYTMLGYFYDSPVGNRLTRLMREEKITPTEGISEEFKQIVDRILSDIQKKSDIDKTLQELREKLSRPAGLPD